MIYINFRNHLTDLHLIFRTVLLASLAVFFSGFLLGDTTTQGRLMRPVIVTLGDHQVVLPSGTVVAVLGHEGENTVVSFNLSDGSPEITQIATASLTVLSATKVAVSGGEGTFDAGSSSASPTSISTGPQSLPTEDDILATNDDPNPEEVRPPPGITLSPEDITLPPTKFTALNGSFYIMIHGQPVLVVYSLPMEGDHLADSASNLVFYGPYPTEKTDLKGNIVPDIVTNLGCAVFSFSFVPDSRELSNPKTAYWSKDSGWFDAVMAARDEIIKEFSLDRKKLLLMGFSGGGGMVLNLASAFPDQVDAVASEGANVAPEVISKNSVSWLIINNRGDTNAEVTIPFYQLLKEVGCSALYCETTPERRRGGYHAASLESFDLIYTFLAGILQQRKRLEEGTQDFARLWPYAADSEPLKRYALISTVDLDNPATASDHYDFLPSAAFASDWSKVCPPIQTVSFSENGKSTRLHVNFPALDKPIGVVLYYDDSNYLSIARRVEDICSLAEHGCMVISPALGMSPERFARAASGWILSQNNLAAVPVHLAGYGQEGACFMADMNNQTQISCKSVTLIGLQSFTIPEDIGEEIKSLAKSCGLYSFFSYQRIVSPTPLDMLSEELVTNESRARGCQNLIVGDFDDSEDVKIKIDEQALDVIKQTVDTSLGNIVSQEPALSLENLILPDQATINNQVEIKVQVRVRGIHGHQGTVQLKSFGTVLSTVRIYFYFDGDQDVTLSYVPTQSGEIPLDVSLSCPTQDSSIITGLLSGKLEVK